MYLYEPIVMPPVLRSVTDGPTLADTALRRRETFPSLQAAYDNFASKPPLNELDAEALRAYVDGGFAQQADGTVRLKCRPEVESGVYRMGSQHEAFAHLGEVQCPVTVAVGVETERAPSRYGALIAEQLPHGRLERHPELGHFGPLQNPAAIAHHIRTAIS